MMKHQYLHDLRIRNHNPIRKIGHGAGTVDDTYGAFPLPPLPGEVGPQTRVRDRYSFLFILHSLFFSKTISTLLRFIERIENKE